MRPVTSEKPAPVETPVAKTPTPPSGSGSRLKINMGGKTTFGGASAEKTPIPTPSPKPSIPEKKEEKAEGSSSFFKTPDSL